MDQQGCTALEGRGDGDGAADAEEGFTTAELLANAALAIAALVAIWLALRGLGIEVVDWIRSQLQM